MTLYFTHLIGRNRNGSEPGGTLIHALQGNDAFFPTYGKALCGAQPGLRSNGWSEYTSTVPTCPKCIAKMEKAKVKP